MACYSHQKRRRVSCVSLCFFLLVLKSSRKTRFKRPQSAFSARVKWARRPNTTLSNRRGSCSSRTSPPQPTAYFFPIRIFLWFIYLVWRRIRCFYFARNAWPSPCVARLMLLNSMTSKSWNYEVIAYCSISFHVIRFHLLSGSFTANHTSVLRVRPTLYAYFLPFSMWSFDEVVTFSSSFLECLNVSNAFRGPQNRKT